jgi:hypothetical protein
MIRRFVAAGCLAALVLAGAAQAGEKGQQDVGTTEKAMKRLLEQLGDRAKTAQVTPITAPALKKAFDGYHFFAVRYRIFPVARMLPKGMKPSNVFAVSKTGLVEHLKDAKVLEGFFRTHAAAAKNEDTAGALAQGWVTLSQEFVQDGFFKFNVGKPEVKSDGGKVVSAEDTAVVMAGGNGQIQATLTFDNVGKLEKVVEAAKVRPGPRPICQATKLLDADPIVRRMAEQDLLYMGLAARDYLMEQRERARPELREAIDRLWRRIEKEGW